MPTMTPPHQVADANNRSARSQYVHLRGKPLMPLASGNYKKSLIRRPSKWMQARLLLVLMLSGMPILAISVDVFGLVPQRISAVVIVGTLSAVLAIMTIWPHRIDVI